MSVVDDSATGKHVLNRKRIRVKKKEEEAGLKKNESERGPWKLYNEDSMAYSSSYCDV